MNEQTYLFTDKRCAFNRYNLSVFIEAHVYRFTHDGPSDVCRLDHAWRPKYHSLLLFISLTHIIAERAERTSSKDSKLSPTAYYNSVFAKKNCLGMYIPVGVLSEFSICHIRLVSLSLSASKQLDHSSSTGLPVVGGDSFDTPSPPFSVACDV
jgi:hypothetical protein